MNNMEYITLDKIRSKYGCKGEVIFRTAIQYIVEYGQHNFKDEVWFDELINDVDERHNFADTHGKFLFMTIDFEKAILECARELAEVNPYELLAYIQKEVWLSANGISYDRLNEMLTDCINYYTDGMDSEGILADMTEEIGFTCDEIEEIGYGHLLDIEDD